MDISQFIKKEADEMDTYEYMDIEFDENETSREQDPNMATMRVKDNESQRTMDMKLESIDSNNLSSEPK